MFFKVHTKHLTDVGRIFSTTECKFGLFRGHFNATLNTIILGLN